MYSNKSNLFNCSRQNEFHIARNNVFVRLHIKNPMRHFYRIENIFSQGKHVISPNRIAIVEQHHFPQKYVSVLISRTSRLSSHKSVATNFSYYNVCGMQRRNRRRYYYCH